MRSSSSSSSNNSSRILSVADQVLQDVEEEEWFDDYVVTAKDPGPILFVAATIICVLLYVSVLVMAACSKAVPSSGRNERQPTQPRVAANTGDEKNVNKKNVKGTAHPFGKDDERQERQSLLRIRPVTGDARNGDRDPERVALQSHGKKLRVPSHSPPPLRHAPLGIVHRSAPPTGRRRSSSITRLPTPYQPPATASEKEHEHRNLTTATITTTKGTQAEYGSLIINSNGRRSVPSITSTTSGEDGLDDPVLALFTNNEGSPTNLRSVLRRVWALTDCCDDWTADILSLGGPFVTQALLSGGSELVRLALVGHLLGTSSLSVYVIVEMLVHLTGDCVGSILGAGNTLIAQLVEDDDDDDDDDEDDGTERNKRKSDVDDEDEKTTAGPQRRSGQYLQLSLLLYIIAYLPIVVLWSTCMGRVLMFLGYTPSMAEEGRVFALPFTLGVMVVGIGSAFQLMLDVVGYQVQSTIMTGVVEVGTTAVLGIVLWLKDDMTLLGLGCLYLATDIVFLVGRCLVIHHNGWLEAYYDGLFFSTGGCTLFKAVAVQRVLSNSTALALAYLVYHCEWQILTFFAGSLGRAEVVAWGLLGTIWDVIERVGSAIGEAAEVRVAMYLGSGQPTAAKVVVYKSYWIALLFTAIVSVLLLAFPTVIPTWLTHDELLQHMLSSLLPFLAVTNFSLTLAIISWSVLYAQNRFQFSVVLSLVVTLGVTLPLACLSSIGYNLNLKGQTAAVVIGIAVSGSIAMHKVIQSDWTAVSKAVITIHEEMDLDGTDANDDEEQEENDNDNDNDTELIAGTDKETTIAPAT